VLEMFAAGELHLSALKLLAPVLDEVNCEQLLAAARFKSKREVEHLLAYHRAQPDVPDAIRKLPQPSLAPKPADDAQTLLLSNPASTVSTPRATGEAFQELGPVPKNEREMALSTQSAPTSTSATLSPLGPSRYKVQLTASQQLHEGRHIPHDVRREVLQRDGARCSFVSEDGKRCEQRGWLELHHEEPFARGGPPTTTNIRVLCAPHNRYLAEHDYGSAFIEQRIARARRERTTQRRVPEREAPERAREDAD
jgi:hypothetical protein